MNIADIEHTPEPWDNETAPFVPAGSDRISIRGRPPSQDWRILSEGNYQHAVHCVNALPAVLEALKICQVRVAMTDGTENEAYKAASAAIDLVEPRNA